jgi:hypothetical protein
MLEIDASNVTIDLLRIAEEREYRCEIIPLTAVHQNR